MLGIRYKLRPRTAWNGTFPAARHQILDGASRVTRAVRAAGVSLAADVLRAAGVSLATDGVRTIGAWLMSGVLLATAATSLAASETRAPLAKLRSGAPHAGAFQPTWAPSLDGSPVEYLVITNRDMASEFERLAAWKTRKGIPAVVRSLDDVRDAAVRGSDLAETIRNYIRDAYSLWGVRFVLLGGDTDVIPARYVDMEVGGSANPLSELYYSCLDGTWNADGDARFGEEYVSAADPGDDVDLISEVFLGRAPVSTVAEARLFVDKTLQYEQPAQLDFQDKMLLLAEVLFPSNYTPGGPPPASDGAAFAEEIALRLAPGTRVTRLYEAQALWPGSEVLTVTAATNAINSGYGTVVHIGHGWRYTLSSGDGSLDVRDAARFDNGTRAGLFYLLNCTATAFDFESMAEGLLLNPNGGACAVVGAAREAFPLSVRAYQSAFFEHLHQRGERQVGVAMAHSRERFATPGMSRIDRWTQLVYTLLGDPELPIWTQARRDLRVNGVPNLLRVGPERLEIEVRNASAPIAGARVCVVAPGVDYRVAQTDVNGLATLDLELTTEADVSLTVTAPDYVPYQKTLQTRARGVALALVDAGVVDDVSGGGNGDGRLDAGETVQLWPRLHNLGSGAAGTVVARLSSTDPGVFVLQDSTSWADLVPGAESGPVAPLRVRTPADVPDGSVVTLMLDLVHADGSASHRLELLVHAAQLRLVGLRLDDSRAGNGNGVQDAGEEIDLYYTVENRGTGTATSVEVQLGAPQAGLSLITAQATVEDVPPGGRRETATALVIRETDVTSARTAELKLVHAQDPASSGRRVDFRVPAAPADLGYGNAGSIDAVRLEWERVQGDDIQGYHVYRARSEAGPFERVSHDVVTQSYFRDAGLAPSTRYTYVVRAIDAAGLEGAASAPLSVSTNPALVAGWPIALRQFTASTPAVGDVNADGVLDVVAAADQIFAWDARGVELVDADRDPVTWGVLYGSEEGFGPVSVADVDGRAGLEIVAATWSETSRHAVVLGASGRPLRGWPQPLAPANASVVGAQVPPVVVDLDRNGAPEILLAARDGRLYGWHADGSEIADGDANASTHGVLLDTGSAFLRCAPGVAELDPTRPGLETVVGATNGVLHVLDASGTALPGWPRTTFGTGTAFGSRFLSGVTIADLDRDGELEMIFLESAGRLHALHLDGSELPGFPIEGLAAQGLSLVPSPAVADIQGGAELEIVAGTSDGEIHLFDFAGRALLTTPIVSGAASESSPLLGDVDGDGAIEIVFGNEDGFLQAWNQDGSEVDGFPIAMGAEVRATPVLVDLDANGTADLVVQGWDGVVRVHDLGVPWVPSRFPWPEHRGGASRVGLARADATTPVLLSDFSVRFDAERGVSLSWRGQSSEPDAVVRWRILRSGPHASDPRQRADWLRDVALVGEQQGTGALDFVDADVRSGHWYAYALLANDSAPTNGDVGTDDSAGYVLVGSISVWAAPPTRPRLLPASPNPFNPGTRITFDVPGSSRALDASPSKSARRGTVREPAANAVRVRLAVYDVEGRLVRVLLQRDLPAGQHAYDWDGHDTRDEPVASGVYVARLQIGRVVLSQKLVRLQ